MKFSRRDPPPKSPPADCPKISIECPTGVLETGKTYVIRLSVESVNPKDGMYCGWTVSNGEIVAGQGTRSLKIRINDPTKEVTATVEVNGI